MSRGVTTVTDLASELGDLPAVRGHFPCPDDEYVKGWGIFALPFDSGHVLALHVHPENDFGPYRSPWHRDPAGRWSIYVDGARLDTACPRYFAAACERTDFAHIELTWTGRTMPSGHVGTMMPRRMYLSSAPRRSSRASTSAHPPI
jgi:hypothetical protein